MYFDIFTTVLLGIIVLVLFTSSWLIRRWVIGERGRKEFLGETQTQFWGNVPKEDILAYDNKKIEFLDEYESGKRCLIVDGKEIRASSSNGIEAATGSTNPRPEDKRSSNINQVKDESEISSSLENIIFDDEREGVEPECTWMRYLNLEDSKKLKACLLKRCIANIPRWKTISNEYGSMLKLYQRGLISKAQWDHIEKQKCDLTEELAFITQEARKIQEGWDRTILSEAAFYFHYQLRKQMEDQRIADEKKKQEKVMKQLMKQEETEKIIAQQKIKAQERRAQKIAENLVKAEEEKAAAAAIRQRTISSSGGTAATATAITTGQYANRNASPPQTKKDNKSTKKGKNLVVVD